MKKCLINAGPLIALFDRDDKYHRSIKAFIMDYKGKIYTTWPVLTDVLNMLDFNNKVQIDFLEWIKRDALFIRHLNNEDIGRIIEITKKYKDIPMSFSDASLILLSEVENINEIISLDSNFYIYRNIIEDYVKNIFIFK